MWDEKGPVLGPWGSATTTTQAAQNNRSIFSGQGFGITKTGLKSGGVGRTVCPTPRGGGQGKSVLSIQLWLASTFFGLWL